MDDRDAVLQCVRLIGRERFDHQEADEGVTAGHLSLLKFLDAHLFGAAHALAYLIER